ncbi:hypothetical protein J2S40_000634 [Nocardioides luteus]|uniref:DUF3048 domain-containing protein n=1 Tax=Nocardioides luteus TaxID=1844 RepID=A0ABQ5T3E6_9ACTN|nr:DUF3048 domain-containing protein [Nocardioides luteus]MDR7309576.1 hypothetical protein [Nocardioides luteus]GGR52162.1 hypothetical protein GCM10010197_17980 [Nocardioides luteus]GLJ70641.1 hypothetical protein GCM10017579_46770 [Nocardioides luteus]
MRTSRPGFLLRAAATLTAAGLVLTGCGSSDEPTDSKPSPSAPAEPDHEPLTGVELPKGQTAEREHPAYIVKIDNTAASDPQYGVAKADMVVQELVEGGVTRLAVAYYSQLPKEAGPVRSMRATDAGIAAPIGAEIMTSGAAPYTFAQLKKHDVKWIDMSTPYVVRDTSKPHDFLHSVVGKVAKAGKAEAKGGDAKRPDDFFPWGDATTTLAGGKPAKAVDVRFSDARTDNWVFRNGKYRLKNNYMSKGGQFLAETVVVAQTKTTIAPYKDPGGAIVPVSHFTGRGKAWILREGQIVEATWEKEGENGTVSLTDAAGKEIKLPPGKVWLDLIPEGNGQVEPGGVTVK